MARFFIISLNYAPEPTGFAPKATAFAGHLARQGHDVHVFTGFPFAPEWKRRESYRGHLFLRERSGNLTVHRVTHFIPRRPSSALQRVLMEASFCTTGAAALVAEMVRRGAPNAVMYIGAQPALAMLARGVAAFASCPYFINVTDLAARAALDVGIVGPSLSRLLESLEFAAYRQAAAAFVLCRSFEDALIAHGFPPRRIHILRDPTDLERIRPVARDHGFRTRYGLPHDAFVILHAGSMGLKQGLRNVVAAASLTRDTDIHWVFVGDGEVRSDLVREVDRLALEPRVHFVPFQPDAELSAMFAAADVLLLNQIRAVKDTVIPSKLLTYMAAGRPVLAAVNAASQAADIIREAEGGILVKPEDPEALAAAARWFAGADAATLEAFGGRNRAYAERHFDQRTIVAAHELIMLGVMRPTSVSAATPDQPRARP